MNGISTSIARQCAEGSCGHVLLVHAVARRVAFVACCFCLINGLWAMNRMKIMFIKFSCLPLTFMRLNVAHKALWWDASLGGGSISYTNLCWHMCA